MKKGLKTKWGGFLVIVLLVFAGNAALAESPGEWVCGYPVTGCVCETTYKGDDLSNKTTIAVLPMGEDTYCTETICKNTDDWVYVKGVPFERLDIAVGDYVVIDAHVCMNLQIKACKVDGTLVFPPGGKEDQVSADVNDNQGNYGQGRF